MQDKINQYIELRKKIKALYYGINVINFDSETIAPVGCFSDRSKNLGVLIEMVYSILTSKEYIELINDLYANKDHLSYSLKIEIERCYKDLQKQLLVPTNETIEFETLLTASSNEWAKAKEENNYDIFAPYLEKIINYKKKYIEYVKTDKLTGYNILLDEFEENTSVEFYDEFFKELRKEIVPLVKKINEKKTLYNDLLLKQKYDVNKQKDFAEYLMDVMCFDKTRGLKAESEHPFTSSFNSTDVRITNHYYEDLLLSSIFSIIHEAGHGLYELQCNKELDDTLISGGTSMALHESQSRFYENIVGRSYEFWKRHYPVLKKTFKKELKDYSLDEFYQQANRVECSLIRTEADELTYPLHIMVRYELEKAIFNNEIEVKDLPKKWNELYKEYLGITVPTDSLGILQDVHWSGGSFGYFPTYALGSAYASQFYYAMKKDIDVDDLFGSNNLEEINKWLGEKVHSINGVKTPEEVLIYATGEKFNPKYYVKYLKEKYSKIYNLD